MDREEVIARVEAGRTSAVRLLREIADSLEGLPTHELSRRGYGD